MRRLLLASCLIASICGYHIKKSEFDVAVETIEYSNLPTKYELSRGDALIPMEEILKRLDVDLKKQPRAGTEAIINDYADKLFANLQYLMIHNGFDPVEMPDMHSGFNYTLIITFQGELDLTHGWLSDLSTLHRGGDVVVAYSSNTKYLEVTVPIAFDDLMFTYDYYAEIMGLGPSGGIEGKAESVTVEVKIGFDAETLVMTLDEFYITNSGHISFHFNGNVLVDWLLNLLSDVVTILLKEVILLVVEGVIRDGLDSVIGAINDAIGGFINPTTPVSVTASAAYYIN